MGGEEGVGANGVFLGLCERTERIRIDCPKSCRGALTCVLVKMNCVAVLHSVIIGAAFISCEGKSVIAPIMPHYVTQLGEVLRSGGGIRV